MKINSDWGVPFKFKDEQRERLINSGWKKPSNRAKAKHFIDSSQIIIAEWLAVVNEGQSMADERRSHAIQINKASQELIIALNTSPADVNETIAAEMDERLFLPREYPEHIEAAKSLKRATGNEHPCLYQMADILEFWLSLLSESAGVVADIKDAPSENKGREKWLISNLATSYKHHFGKPPAAGTDSCFRIFCSELSEILGYKLGKKIITEVLAIQKPSTFSSKKTAKPNA